MVSERPAPEVTAPQAMTPQTSPVIDQGFDAGALYVVREAVAAHAAQRLVCLCWCYPRPMPR